MDNIRIRRTWNQASTLRVDNLLGTAFIGENQAHTFEITGVNGQTPVPITGSLEDGAGRISCRMAETVAGVT